jgi:basic amino acid/polyamine antiporter, APA family
VTDEPIFESDAAHRLKKLVKYGGKLTFFDRNGSDLTSYNIKQPTFAASTSYKLLINNVSQPTHESLNRSLGLMDGAMIVIGSMVGSGVFIVSADIMRTVGSPGLMLGMWAITGFLVLIAALSYGELAGMFPNAGGQYVYLREAYNPLVGFLYGWAFFAVIQTGTIAAVGVAFAKFASYLLPALSEKNYLLQLGGFRISAGQLLAIFTIVLLTWVNTQGLQHGRWVQLIFTLAKIGAIGVLIVMGLTVGFSSDIWAANWGQKAFAFGQWRMTDGVAVFTEGAAGWYALGAAMAVASVGSIFSMDAWNNVTFVAGEMRNPKRNIGLSLIIGTLTVTVVYLLINLMFTATLSASGIAFATDDRVGIDAGRSFMGSTGVIAIAVMIMISTFGCNNGLILSGARVYYTMAKDGLFFQKAAQLNNQQVPSAALWAQCVWASLLCLTGRYGDLLDYVIFTVLLFYLLTIAGIYRLRRTRPDAERPYRAFGYPVLPALYLLIASFICVMLLIYKPLYSWPGLGIVLLGVPVYYALIRRSNSNQAP